MSYHKRMFSLTEAEYEANAENELQLLDMLTELKYIFTIRGIAKHTQIPKYTVDKYSARIKAIIPDDHLQKIKEVYEANKHLIKLAKDTIKIYSVHLPCAVKWKMHVKMDEEGKKMSTVITEALMSYLG